MVGDGSGDDDLNVDQHQTGGQHNLQWIDTLIGHTSCAAESGGNGQHPSLGAPISAWPAWEHVSPPAQHNRAGSSGTRIVTSTGSYSRWPPVPRDPSIGALLASSFCERVHSCANQVVILGNTLLGDGEMEKIMMCRMDRDFIVFICKHYPQVANEQFECGTILTVEDNEEDEDEWKTVHLQHKFILDRDQSPTYHSPV